MKRYEEYEKIKYTILRDSLRRPTVTICEIASNGCVGIGIAIRSINDNPVEKIGKVKARGRAIKALVRRKESLPIARSEAFTSMSCVCPLAHIGPFYYKSIYQEV
uniref:Uncharacterized protein n=1 Tax=viral metagenome TaxID=1070528 RepID=A0A6M3L9G3_9ZZZZ